MLLQRLLVISLYLAVAASLLTSMVKYLSPLHPDDFAQLWYLSIINEVPLSISAMTGLALFINYTFSQEATESPSTSNASVANCFRVITASGSRKVEYQDVSFIKAAGNFMELHLRTGEELLHRSTMKKLTELLDEDEFYRVHRSYLVNIADILEVTSNENNEPCLLMRNKVCISVSRQYAKKLRERFNTKTLKQALLH
ncbi:hypothetical protein tinsulaeT_05730 [Thalassotalea insulae]|uniref:HTH LytTR-type domain-containing protein n=2 Tax=Thalassotalea insulae TaxID=2056778 RepID=A0ABQ6GMM4_9GAMM|nr:hypothetical protein tinsulaeT_05730 [Thalassotalea insulae]